MGSGFGLRADAGDGLAGPLLAVTTGPALLRDGLSVIVFDGDGSCDAWETRMRHETGQMTGCCCTIVVHGAYPGPFPAELMPATHRSAG